MFGNQNRPDRHVYQTEQEVIALGNLLKDARNSDDSARIHAALIETLEGVIEQLRKQARVIEDLRSDMTHKQGIVTTIAGGAYEA